MSAIGQAQPRPPGAPIARPTVPATFVQGYPGVVPRAHCEDFVRRFEADPRKYPSRTATRRNPLVRSGMMLDIPLYPEWTDACELMARVTRGCLDDYVKRFPSLEFLARPENSRITPPILERIEPGQG